jgi:hypothetical protein
MITHRRQQYTSGQLGSQLAPLPEVTSFPAAYIESLQLYPGDVVRWRCSYDTSDMQPGSTLKGGYSSAASSLQEQCTVVLHYWPRVESMRGCAAATLGDALLGENMCSNEAEDLLAIAGAEQQQMPLRWVLWMPAQQCVAAKLQVIETCRS